MDLSISSITPSKQDVNSKYSMQESDNNSASFNLSVKDSKGNILSKETTRILSEQ